MLIYHEFIPLCNCRVMQLILSICGWFRLFRLLQSYSVAVPFESLWFCQPSCSYLETWLFAKKNRRQVTLSLIALTPNIHFLCFLNQPIPEVRMCDVNNSLSPLPGAATSQVAFAVFGNDNVRLRTGNADY